MITTTKVKQNAWRKFPCYSTVKNVPRVVPAHKKAEKSVLEIFDYHISLNSFHRYYKFNLCQVADTKQGWELLEVKNY